MKVRIYIEEKNTELIFTDDDIMKALMKMSPENRRNVLAVPKVGGYYLVTYYGKYADFLPLVKESKYLNGNFSVENVIAWRELPLPYGGN